MSRLQIGHVPVDRVTLDEALDGIARLTRSGGGVVFTPNADHVVRAETELDLRAAYGGVTLSLADGMPVVWASHALGRPLPERVAGADLLSPLMARAARDGLRVYLLGGRESAGRLTRERLLERHPDLQIVGVGPTTRAILAAPAELDRVEQQIVAARAHLAIVALGSPLQEVWSARVRARVAPTVLIGLGSALDVFTGLVPRAPVWMRRSGLEWAFRLGQEPRRLWRRYLLEDPRFFALVARQLLTGPR